MSQTSILDESAKDYGSRRTWPESRPDLASLNYALAGNAVNRRQIRQANEQYQQLKASRGAAMRRHLEAFDAGRLTAGQLAVRLKGELAIAQREAFRLGLRAAGYPAGIDAEDERWLRGARRYEWRFLNRFMEDLANDRLRMPAVERLQMYTDTVDAFFWHGKVDGSPRQSVIHWRLSPAEHCATCLSLSAGGPYTQETLPTTPRSGYSECLSNCRCWIEIQISDAGATAPSGAAAPPAPAAPVLPAVGRPVPRGFRLPSPEEQAIIDARLLQAGFYREAAMQTQGAELRRLLAQREAAIEELNAYMRANRLVLRDTRLLDSVVFGAPPAADVRTGIFNSGMSAAALRYLGSGVEAIVEQMTECASGKRL